MNLAIVAITPGGADLARRLGKNLPRAIVHLPEALRREDGCTYFSGAVKELLPELFRKVEGLICIMASGIVVRILAPHLRKKTEDPGVVVMDEKGAFAVSLLSGHFGGANALAWELSRICGCQAVITTATDVNGLPAWDEAARKEGMWVEPVKNVRHLNSLLLRREKIVLVDRRDGRLARHFESVPEVIRVHTFAEAILAGGKGKVFVTNRFIPDLEHQDSLLVLRPRNLVLGIGCNRGAPLEDIENAVITEMHHAFLSLNSIACLATIEEKRDEEGILQFARRYRLPVEFHSAADLNRVSIASEPSSHALAAVGAHGVCEPAAILSSGNGNLLVKKKRHLNVTVAVAERPED